MQPHSRAAAAHSAPPSRSRPPAAAPLTPTLPAAACASAVDVGTQAGTEPAAAACRGYPQAGGYPIHSLSSWLTHPVSSPVRVALPTQNVAAAAHSMRASRGVMEGHDV
eukprot:CAMPEP_0202337704 /NCGR_PEP_ID=MMETSP1126-20121109/283_1 /ASSEMBLY_ACC=CAM_ASM_000457 /TAXON_ID=3047 /ORGANISM="Dunaliella tertiolecta, Strain CCMP1320" /LENGTH=108 /DNA_ID=CAMNT_0048927955 /DNA_START=986 /DNA_END=1313 /DNA_ORIENTATION=-